MTSFITCSDKSTERLKLSIEALGLLDGWELLSQRASPGIASAYNQGVTQSKGETFVFLHDDVTLLGNHYAWSMITNQLTLNKCGFVGVTGTKKLDHNGCWWDSEKKLMRGGLLHASPDSMRNWAGADSLPYYLSSWPQTGAAYFGRCVVLDGVFLVTSRETFREVGGFDTLTFPGFDLYDIDITLRAHVKGYTNWVVPFPVMHSTTRPIGETYDKARRKFCQKYSDVLPLSC